MKKEKILYSITEVDSDFIGDTPDKILDGLNEGTNYINYDYKKHRYLITFISDYFNAFDKIEEDRKEIERLNNDIKILLQENSNKEKVIIKQDNIINELEKTIIFKICEFKRNKDYFIDEKDMEQLYEELKELKESEK